MPFFPPNSVSRSRGPSGARHFSLNARGVFPVHSRVKWLVTCPCAFRLHRLARKFSHKMALVTCPCAFRLHRLAQSVGRGLGIHLGRGIFLANSGSCDMTMCISTAQARAKCGSRSRDPSGARHFPKNSRVKSLLWSWRSPCEKILWRSRWNQMKSSKKSLRDLVQLLGRSFSRDPDEILSEVLAWSCTGPCEEICQKPWWNPLRGPCMRSLWEDLVGILVNSFQRSLHDLAQVLVRRSCGNPSVILVSKHNVAPVTKEVPTAAVAMSNLICCIRSYCCLYLLHWHPIPHTVWGLSLVYCNSFLKSLARWTVSLSCLMVPHSLNLTEVGPSACLEGPPKPRIEVLSHPENQSLGFQKDRTYSKKLENTPLHDH